LSIFYKFLFVICLSFIVYCERMFCELAIEAAHNCLHQNWFVSPAILDSIHVSNVSRLIPNRRNYSIQSVKLPRWSSRVVRPLMYRCHPNGSQIVRHSTLMSRLNWAFRWHSKRYRNYIYIYIYMAFSKRYSNYRKIIRESFTKLFIINFISIFASYYVSATFDKSIVLEENYYDLLLSFQCLIFLLKWIYNSIYLISIV